MRLISFWANLTVISASNKINILKIRVIFGVTWLIFRLKRRHWLQGVMPDIVTMAKGIGNGYPLAAVVTTPEIAAVMARRLHFNTYGGNPVVSAAGRAVLRVIDDEDRQRHCATVGNHLLARLDKLKAKHDIIGDVRGSGLMLGVEMVTDRSSKVRCVPDSVLLV